MNVYSYKYKINNKCIENNMSHNKIFLNEFEDFLQDNQEKVVNFIDEQTDENRFGKIITPVGEIKRDSKKGKEYIKCKLSVVKDSNIKKVAKHDAGKIILKEKDVPTDETTVIDQGMVLATIEVDNFVIHIERGVIGDLKFGYTEYSDIIDSFEQYRTGGDLKSEIKKKDKVKEILLKIDDINKIFTSDVAVKEHTGATSPTLFRKIFDKLKSSNSEYTISCNIDKKDVLSEIDEYKEWYDNEKILDIKFVTSVGNSQKTIKMSEQGIGSSRNAVSNIEDML